MKFTLLLILSALNFASADDEVQLKDDVASRLMWSNDVSSKDNVVEAFLSVASIYCPEFSLLEIMRQLEGGDGLISYNKKEASISFIADGAQETQLKFNLQEDENYGVVAVVRGKTFDPTSKQEWTPFTQRLLRVEGGWIDLSKDWKSLVNTSVYDVQIGDSNIVYTIHWVKNSKSIFGYSYEKQNLTKRTSIRGLNPSSGKLTIKTANTIIYFVKKTQNGKVVWVSKSNAISGQKAPLVMKKR